jgi:O-antigen/teichoic acid export membrane protein
MSTAPGVCDPIAGMRRVRSREDAVLLRQTIAVVFVRVLGLALAFATSIVLARIMGAEGFGIYSFAISVVIILRIVALFGLDGLLVRDVAASRELDQPGRLKGIVVFGVAATLLLSLAVTFLAQLAIRNAAPPDWPYADTLAIALLALAPMALLGGAAAILEAFRLPLPGQIAETILRPGLFLILVGVVVLPLRRHLTPEIAVGLHALTYFGALLAAVRYLSKRIERDVWTAPAAITARAWLGAAAGFALTNAAYIITENTGVIMLAALADPEAVGIFRAATRYAQLVPFALLAAMLPLRPAISAAFARDDRIGQRRAARTAAALAMAMGLPAAALLVAFGDVLLAVFGDDFSHGRAALTILVLGQVVNVAAGNVGVLMTMTGHEKRVAATVGAAAACNVMLNLLLIPRFGTDGAAAATAISLALWNASMLYWVIKHLRINPTIFGSSPRE